MVTAIIVAANRLSEKTLGNVTHSYFKQSQLLPVPMEQPNASLHWRKKKIINYDKITSSTSETIRHFELPHLELKTSSWLTKPEVPGLHVGLISSRESTERGGVWFRPLAIVRLLSHADVVPL